MKKILLAILFVIIAINYQSCKVLKKIHRSRHTVDSTAITSEKVQVKTATKDSSNMNSLSNYLNIALSSNLSIGKLKETTEEAPPSSALLTFNIDSLNLKGDTAKAIAADGTKLQVYQDKKTGRMVAAMEHPGTKTKTLEVENVTLKTSKNIDSGSLSQQKQVLKTLTVDSAFQKNSDVKLKSITADTVKDVKRSFDYLKFALFASLAIMLIIVVYKLNKKYSLKSKVISWVKGVLTGV
ncbi:hypothetical protein [Arachidicoccus soli]|uniref:Uncharacterized protein n=1 Tax=Arachidicoccus soli TaxID=2341117 RepID=A0A386HQH0_9BACT|nr:hypothetical protein [Arachidicoccus soli]AYD48187.1 hypothetical protein D6B99_11625 [Arachidicoccus soli]